MTEAESVRAPDVLPEAEPPPSVDASDGGSGPPDPELTEPASPAVVQRRGGAGFAGLFLGGVVAAALGAGAALYVLPEGWRQPERNDETARLSTLEEQMAGLPALGEEVAGLRAAAESARSEAAAASARAGEAASAAEAARALSQRLDSLDARLGEIDARLTTLEKRPVAGGAVSDSAVAAFEREMEDMRSLIARQSDEVESARAAIAAAAEGAEERIAAAEAEAERLRAEAEEAAGRTSARAALSHLQAALESGAPLDGALSELNAAGVEIPEALSSQTTGVPSLTFLRTSFPEAARDALTVSLQETAGEGWTDRLSAFLRSQTQARSLTPRAGDDPDAVLSRAEAALGTGDLDAALAELGALPETGRARMAEWIALAEKRRAAVGAVEALAAELN